MSPLKFLKFLIQIEVGSWDWILEKTSHTRFLFRVGWLLFLITSGYVIFWIVVDHTGYQQIG
jgi:hypothetical protein